MNDTLQLFLADPLVRTGLVIAVLAAFALLAWGGLAALDEGIGADGVVSFDLDQPAPADPPAPKPTANPAAGAKTRRRIAGLRASERRLVALQSGKKPDFGGLGVGGLAEDDRDDIAMRQHRLYAEQMRGLQSDIAVLSARRDGALRDAALKCDQIGANARTLEAARRQLEVSRKLMTQNLAREATVRRLEREVAERERVSVRLEAEHASSLRLADEMVRRIAEARARHKAETAEELSKVRARLKSAEKK